MRVDKEYPTLSIIIPVYKAEEFLPECIESVLKQTFKDFELILVNDGSPDKCEEICRSYADLDQRINVISKKNGGASSARNAGLDCARGRYIGWVDADDRIASDMYSTLIGLIEEYDADIADSQYYQVDHNGVIKSGRDEQVVYGSGNFIMHEFFASRMKPGLTTKIYRRELWNNIRFPLGRNHQDFYVNVLFALRSLTYVRTPEAKYYYIIRDKSITTTKTSRELREAIYKYQFTINLAKNNDYSKLAKTFLRNDGISRLMWRYYDISINSKVPNQYVYNHYIRGMLGWSIVKYLVFSNLPLKTRISYILLLLDFKSAQKKLHDWFGK